MAKSREQYIAERTDDYEGDLYTFNLVDRRTVERLARDGDIKLPYKDLDKIKDERWNTKQFASRLLQGILNGDPIPEIANRLLDVVGYNEASAMRNARTMTTAAENLGRQDSYEELDDNGVVQKKVWIATPDDRTRASHLEIDGEERDIDEDFSNGCAYPADPDCDDMSEIYNCRCSMRDKIVGFRRKDGSISPVGRERDTTMHAEQIAAEQEKRAEAAKMLPVSQAQEAEKPKERVESSKIKATMSTDDYERFIDLATNADNSELYRNYADTVGSVRRLSNGGAYSRSGDTLTYSYETHEGMSKYSTLAHEYNHAFDDKIGKHSSLTFSEMDTINSKCKIGSGIITPIKEYASQSDEFMNALRKDMEALKTKGLEECYKEFRTTNVLRNATGGVQDALDGFYSTQKTYQGWGHGETYYNRMYNRYIKGFDNEKELKDALIDNIQKFLLELGNGFAFVGRETRLLVGGNRIIHRPIIL